MAGPFPHVSNRAPWKRPTSIRRILPFEGDELLLIAPLRRVRGLFRWRRRGHENEGPGTGRHPFTRFLLGDPRDVVLKGRCRGAIGPFHAADLASHVHDGDVLAD